MVSAKPAQGAEPVQCSGAAKINPPFEMGVDNFEDCYTDEKILDGIWEVYHSWIDAHISDFNTDFYYQPRDYLAACYQEGVIL